MATFRHPDKNQNSQESNQMMQRINAAKDKLSQSYEDDDDDDDEDYDYDDDDYDDVYDPFADEMDFGAFLRM